MKANDEIIYVLCGSIQEFRAYCFKQTNHWHVKSHHKINGKRYMFVSRKDVLYGIKNPTVVMFGQYHYRPDFNEMRMFLQAIDAKIIMAGEEDDNQQS